MMEKIEKRNISKITYFLALIMAILIEMGIYYNLRQNVNIESGDLDKGKISSGNPSRIDRASSQSKNIKRVAITLSNDSTDRGENNHHNNAKEDNKKISREKIINSVKRFLKNNTILIKNIDHVTETAPNENWSLILLYKEENNEIGFYYLKNGNLVHSNKAEIQEKYTDNVIPVKNLFYKNTINDLGLQYEKVRVVALAMEENTLLKISRELKLNNIDLDKDKGFLISFLSTKNKDILTFIGAEKKNEKGNGK